MTRPFMRTQEEGIELSMIKSMELKASAIPDVISLAQGIPSFDTMEVIKRYAISAIEAGKVSKYSLSPGLPVLREAIERSLERDNLHYDYSSEILVTAGSIEGITATLLALLRPGEEVILVSPSYASYPHAVKVAHGRVVWVDLNESDGWNLNIENIRSSLTTQTRAILLANPNNPTGTIFKQDELRSLAELAVEHNLLLIIDEVYKDLIYNNEPYWNPAEDPQFRRNIVIVYSFSKTYAMTGWRVAFAVTDASIMSEILKVHDALVTCAPVVSQYAALAALELASNDIALIRTAFQQRRDRMCKHLDAMNTIFTYQFPTASYFVFPRLRDTAKNSLSVAMEYLERAHVAVVPGSAFGPAGEHHLRLCFGRTPEDIDEAFRRLNHYHAIL